MKTVEEFINTMVKIEYIEQSNCFGHYPFQLFAETKDGGHEMNALALGGDVKACYERFLEYERAGAKRIYLSLDFPKGGDMNKDFVAIITLEDGEIDIFAIPYNVDDGDQFNRIEKSEQLNKIELDLMYFFK